MSNVFKKHTFQLYNPSWVLRKIQCVLKTFDTFLYFVGISSHQLFNSVQGSRIPNGFSVHHSLNIQQVSKLTKTWLNLWNYSRTSVILSSTEREHTARASTFNRLAMNGLKSAYIQSFDYKFLESFFSIKEQFLLVSNAYIIVFKIFQEHFYVRKKVVINHLVACLQSLHHFECRKKGQLRKRT